jgi:putative acetyltransferase
MTVRKVTKSDIPVLAKLFDNSVRQVAPQQYSPQQVAAWAASSSDMESFSKFILEPTTFVAEIDNLILGFGGVTTAGYLVSLYVRGDYNRQGIGSQLLTKIIEYAGANNIDRLYTEASEFSKPLFEKFGFEVCGEEEVTRNGIIFHRYLMQKVN